jgi:hypothetical protein
MDTAEPDTNDREGSDAVKCKVYGAFKDDLLSKDFCFSEGIHVALMGKKYKHHDDDLIWGHISRNEIHGSGYEAYGKPLLNMSISKNKGGIHIDGDDIVWDNAYITAHAIVMYASYTHRLVGSFIFDHGLTCNRKFIIEWNDKGVIYEPNPDEPPQYLTSYLEGGIH